MSFAKTILGRSLLLVAFMATTTGCETLRGMLGKRSGLLRPGAIQQDGEDGGLGNSALGSRPKLKLSPEDPAVVSNLIGDLNRVKDALDRTDLEPFGNRVGPLCYYLRGNPDPELKSHFKYPILLKRLHQLEQRYVNIVGGHAQELFADGKGVSTMTPEAVEPVEKMLKVCQSAKAANAETLNRQYREYEAMLAQIRQRHPNALRFRGTRGDACYDVPILIAKCEAAVKESRMNLEDYPPHEKYVHKQYRGCGYELYQFRALKIGRNRFEPFRLTGSGFGSTEVVCSKIPRRSNIPAVIKRVLRNELPGLKQTEKLVVEASSYIQVGFRIYKNFMVRVYDRKTNLSTAACGTTNKKLACEAAGSKTAKAYNRISHFMKRAMFHKGGRRAERCKKMLSELANEVKGWERLHETLVRRGEWVSGMKYRTLQRKVLSEKQIIRYITQLGELADDTTCS